MSLPFGVSRSIDPPGVLPIHARRLDNRSEPGANEFVVHVDELLITSTAFHALMQHEDPAARCMCIVDEFGCFRDPDTGSGGMLRGSIGSIGADIASTSGLAEGVRIATLISLAATPLRLSRIRTIDSQRMAISVVGEAILPQEAPWVILPADLSETVAIGSLDVCGAPALAARNVQPGNTTLVVGGGRAGTLVALVASQRAGPAGRVIVVDNRPHRLDALRRVIGVDTICADATQPLQVYEQVMQATRGQGVDVAFSCGNVANAEAASFLPTRNGGTVIYFSMSTDFVKTALGAESTKKDVQLLIGSGWLPGHQDLVFSLLRAHPEIHDLLTHA